MWILSGWQNTMAGLFTDTQADSIPVMSRDCAESKHMFTRRACSSSVARQDVGAGERRRYVLPAMDAQSARYPVLDDSVRNDNGPT